MILRRRKSSRDYQTNHLRCWYINGQGQTIVVIPGPVEFWMGEADERHRSRIGRSFALAPKM